ncbi:putative aquaporin SIP1-1/2 [Helianthus debilis subsp. tardiflorus]
MGLVKAAIGDAVVTLFQIQVTQTSPLIFVISVLFGLIIDLFGGASFNATDTVAFYIVGAAGDDDTLMSMVVRFPIQNFNDDDGGLKVKVVVVGVVSDTVVRVTG